ncbi:MAG: discoidin domain-containing protein [Phycisphaerae bacterium]|nr:discoidin domain-containing protein [Phycisphaerae bacterium]
MSRELGYLVCIALLLCAAGGVRAGVFTDSFDTARDYLADGVGSTGWDGLIGGAAGETASAINASMDRSGQLFLQSSGAYWSEPWSPLGPFLYKVVKGDFVATVKVTDYAGTSASAVLYNNCGLMARVASDADAGTGEDWISIDYFPLYSVGNIVRYADNDARSEDVGGNGTGWNGYTYLQIERVDNTFYLRTSSDGVTWTDYPDAAFTGLERSDLDGLPVQVGVHQATFTSSEGYAAFDEFRLEGPQVVPMMKAYNAVPANESEDVVRDVVLSWTPYESAAAHDVYFATDRETVAAASRTDPLGVALATGQDANSYDIGVLEFGQTYYWRVDEVGADGTLYPGDVWMFTVEPYAYAITGVTATASSSYSANSGPEKTVDRSGLDDYDEHGDDSKTMWLSKKNVVPPTWIQYEFPGVYKVDHVLVWNSNQAMEIDFGLGVKDATVEYSTDGSTWTTLGDVELTQGTGAPLSPQSVDLGGIVAKYVKLTILSNWGGVFKQYSLSEVRFYSVPVAAREPSPDDGDTGVDPQVTLSWRAGREAASHQVYLSTDEQAVFGGTADVVTTSETQHEISLDMGQSYFWKVVEVNNAEDPASWEGEVWTFTTAEYVVVDDFESYGDDMNAGEAIFQTWGDGYEDDSNGSIVGYGEAPFAERTIVHGGYQSMPLAYENTSTAPYSETKRTFDTAQNWSAHGVKTLVLYWQGLAANTSATLYVKINDTKVVYNAGAGATTMPLWKQWNIDLAATGANLKSVKSLTIGIGDGKTAGTGTIYVDDIRLYAAAPEVVTPADPGAAGIVANYNFDGNAQDSSGKGNHGTIEGDAGYEAAPSGYGQALIFNGINGYVTLPIGSVISSLSDMTIAVYMSFPDASGDWQRVFDFGSSTTNYMFLTPSMTTSSTMRFAIRTDAVGEQTLTAPSRMSVGWHHVAVVMDSVAMTMQLYLDGEMVASGATMVLPKDLGVTTQNYLGDSQFEADALFTGSLADFRIYSRALSEAQIRYLAGDR